MSSNHEEGGGDFSTRHLVVTGLYRYVRNPMCVGVVSAILGQAPLLENAKLRVRRSGPVSAPSTRTNR